MATLIRSDLEFILQQILIAEHHATGADLPSLLPNELAMLGLRTVDGSFNNVVPGQEFFGAADQLFPRLLDPFFRTADTFGTYASSGTVVDSQPRTISNLIVDQTITNPAAVGAFVDAGFGILADGSQLDPNTNLPYPVGTLLDLSGIAIPGGVTLTIPNTAPDEGLSAGFNSWFTFFGQFFDHGLDLVTKGGNGVVIVPLQPDDPLYVEGGTTNFMLLTRATQFDGPGADGVLGDDPTTIGVDESLDDTTHEAENTTTPFVDQNQTYTSHSSHQVFLREYVIGTDGRPVATGALLDNTTNGGIPTWAQVKAQALAMLGIELSDFDVHDVPLLRTDLYGNFIPDPITGFAQVITGAGVDGILNTIDDEVEVGSPGTPVSPTAVGALRTGHAFLNDIAHHAAPGTFDDDGNPLTPPILQVADSDPGTTDDFDPSTYDDELLNAHFVTGDGRGNENIALTAVHHIFHSEHNRQVAEIQNTLVADALASGNVTFLNDWLATDVLAVPGDVSTLVWDGERLFQAAKFATEMQYQHLVFEEFARKVQPNIDEFLMYDATIDPAIVAEFAHVVYRFGHSLLTETVDRLDPNFVSSDIDLIEAFLNPLAFDNDGALSAAEAAGAIVRGMTRQAGNEIDEFVTEALRNNLLGLPLDLPTINLTRGRDTGVPSLNAARRDFYEHTSDSQLRPYTSWVDLANNLKHAASVINFIAAYGTHAELTALDVDTLAEKRAVATALVMGGSATINTGTPEERIFLADETDRLAFLNSTGGYANLANGVTTTGVDDIDLWVGGLAERQMPFGGLLGSTFNFVFETQLEALQNHDRFYYLGRLAGLNFLTEMENNSFAKLIMANTDATHLPADVFSTPTWILEIDPSKQFNDTDGDGILDSADPIGGTELLPLVIRDDPATPGADSNYLRYTGPDHVVLGGTDPGNAANPSGDDILIGSEGDDTFWGDGGNDRIEGGFGNDQIEGGAGDDIITDIGGDDIIKGGAGNDVIHGGQGINLIIAGDGKDFVITGEDQSETFGGQGDDFILGSKTNLPSLGNEGNDWIELGTQDGAPGDNFNLLNLDDVKGHDVIIGGGGFDEMLGEGGDDIFVGSEGEDHFDGASGFDWTTYKNDTLGVTVDLLVNDFIEPPTTPSNAGIQDRFSFVEGLSGSAFADILRGDDQEAADILIAGARGSVLDQEGIDLVSGLQDLLGADVTSFGGGNIMLGGDGSDLIEGRAGNDIIDGDAWMNVRISVRANIDGTGAELFSVDSMTELVQDMLAGTINPGQLQIVREILPGSDGLNFDTAIFSGNFADYTIVTEDNGTPLNTNDDIVIVTDNVVARDGVDRLTHIERLQFADQAVVLAPGLNSEPVGALAISDTTPSVNQLVTVSNVGVTDADGITAGSFNYLWQVERNPGTGVFTDIIQDIGGSPSLAHGISFRVTADLDGLVLRVRATYKDGDGTLENVYSAATAAVAGVVAPPPAPGTPPAETIVASPGNGVHFIRSDLDFILQQIQIAESNSNAYGTAAQPLTDLLPNSRVAFGLRTVDGSFNNLIPGQEGFGASDQNFPLQLDQVFRNDQDGDTFGPVTNTNYASTISVADADPRIISNLIVDQTITNPVAVQAYVDGGFGILADGSQIDPGTLLPYPVGTLLDLDNIAIPAGMTLTLPNVTPDAALSAGFNTWFTFFGQFFDHGLDLVDKGGNGTVFMPLMPDDPLFVEGSPTNFMVLTRATNSAVNAGADGILGTPDDVHLHNNETTPFVDQNQTYTSHASHQVFLREYVMQDIPGDTLGLRPVATGRLIDGANGGIGNWAEVKAQAADLLGIQLTDFDIHDVPLLATDLYGKFIPGSNGFAQFVTATGLVEANPADNGGLGTLMPANGLRTGHAFLNDIAHHAAPGTFDPDGPGGAPAIPQVADSDAGPEGLFGDDFNPATYDNELLDAHFITGDGRGNENIGLTSVHFIFHAEHNRLAGHIKDVAIASNDVSFLNQWLLTPVAALPANQAEIDALQWNGERLFQAARFGTEMQYQHLVFEEFARKIQPQVDIFFAATQVYDTAINPAIVAEFAHVVYRFGHSLLPDTVDRFDPDFSLVGADTEQIGLIEAFLNPLEFTASGADDVAAAGAIIRGVTRQIGNEIDEFVTEAVRNNLLGLPLDLPAINLARGRDTGVPPLNQARAEFYAMTGDSQLKPYMSWADLASNLKHAASLVNFIAAYGTHESIALETTTAGKRAAAYALVYGENGLDGIPLSGDEPTVPVPADRLEFLNSTGTWASNLPADPLRPKDVDSVSTTGLGSVDLWIGGLAEKQMPFGGLLGSTFNFVFETQMEKLQDGDRFYYLERTAGMNFLTELENNSFAKLIMANTDVTHLPGDVFTTPAFTLEVDQALQFTGLGLLGRDDPIGDVGLDPLVLRSDPNDPLNPFYLEYNGVDHVVLGGTASNDTIIASIGDDTLYGDDGDDRLDGGDGVDIVFGGAGDDIMTDLGGDDLMQGQDGDDAIHGGNGINLILGGFGNDFIVTGEDASEAFGGFGDDYLLGVRANEFVFGNEGDDWIEVGMADGAAGDNFDPFGRDLIRGNDVFIGEGLTDRMDGEGGDDIMVGNGGEGDRYEGFSGFDWAVFKDAPTGATVDLTLRAFDETPVPSSAQSILARFTSVEGLSGSAHADFLRGDDADAAAIAVSGAYGSVLENIALIDGLQEVLDGLLGGPVTSFGAGNIILGGAGSDLIEGRGGDDLIDGDAWLNVRIGGVDVNGDPVGGDSMKDLQARVFAGEINPGDLHIVREIMTSPTQDFDTAIFSGLLADYTVTQDDRGTADTSDDVYTVIDVNNGIDGTDTLRNIERLQFSDQALVINGTNASPLGLLTIDDATPAEDQLLTVSIAGVTDANNVSPTNPTGAITGPITYFWQFEPRPGTGVFEDIVIETEAPEVVRATGLTFTPGDAQVGLALRVRAVYKDANGVLETVFSTPTAPVANVNDAPTGAPTISDTTPTEGRALTVNTATIIDLDGTTAAVFTFQWQQANATGVGGGAAGFSDIVGATGQLFVPTEAQVNRELRVVVTFTDDQGTTEIVFSAPTTVVGDLFLGGAAADSWNGTEGQDIASGGGGIDLLVALGGNDILDAGAGADTVIAGAGNDTITGGIGVDQLRGEAGNDIFTYTFGDGADGIDGGADLDTLNILGTVANDTLDVIFDGTALTNFEGGTITGVESVTADLLTGIDTLTYAGTTAAVTVDLSAGTASGFTSIAGIENVTGGTGGDTLTGDGNANALLGGGGNDILNGGLGNDVLNGGAGIDTASFAGEIDDFFVDLVAGTSRRGSAANPIEDTLVGIENVTSGSGHDTISGTGAANTLDGGAGNDTLIGGAGNDVLIGGLGNDTFTYTFGHGADTVAGGAGTDTLSITGTAAVADVLDVVFNGTSITTFEGGTVTGVESVTADLLDGLDTLTYAGTTADVTVSLATGSASGFTSIAGIENVTGGSGNDTLTGDGLVNNLNGGAGNDTLDGGLGNDTLVGGLGDDTYFANNGDILTEGAGAGSGIDSVFTASNIFTLAANVENLTFTGAGNFAGTGNASNNVITGGAGNDLLNSAGGADTLIGGAGNDIMNGGAGNDMFVFAAGFGNDIISGFDANPGPSPPDLNQDLLDISGLTAGNFAARVSIVDLGADTVVTIDGTDTITLLGVNGVGANIITQQDFLLH